MRHIKLDRDRMEFFQSIRADYGIDVGQLSLQFFQHSNAQRAFARRLEQTDHRREPTSLLRSYGPCAKQVLGDPPYLRPGSCRKADTSK